MRSSISQLFVALCLSFFALFANAEGHGIPTSADQIRPILVGQSLPSLPLLSSQGTSFNLKAQLEKKPALLIFYRGGWCPYCNTHLANLRKIEKELLGLGIDIYAISPDLPKFLRETGEKNKLPYTLLSDSLMASAKALGLAFQVDAETLKLYQSYNIDLERNSGQKHHLLPVPAALLVNTDGVVTFTFVAPNYKVRVDNDVILAAAKSLISNQKKSAE